MKHPLQENGEIALLTNDTRRHVAINEYEQWQVDSMLPQAGSSTSSICLKEVENIVSDWLEELTPQEWNRIGTYKSLRGIELPKKWIAVWRFILKEPRLRDSDAASNNGQHVGTYTHIWNLWSEDCIERFLGELDKELLALVDSGLPYQEIGIYLNNKYGEEFYKSRKKDPKTTLAQVVNYYLYMKLPTKIVRAELLEACLMEFARGEKYKNREYKISEKMKIK